MTRVTCDRAFNAEDWHGRLVAIGENPPRRVLLVVLNGALMDLYLS